MIHSWGLRLRLKRSNSRTEESMNFLCALDVPTLTFSYQRGGALILSDQFALDFRVFHCCHEFF